MCSTDISGFLKTAWHYNPEDHTLQNTHSFEAITRILYKLFTNQMDEIMLDHQEDDGRIFFEKEQANKKLP
jgi:hypothetical protein